MGLKSACTGVTAPMAAKPMAKAVRLTAENFFNTIMAPPFVELPSRMLQHGGWAFLT
jgi:hypothetical protein